MSHRILVVLSAVLILCGIHNPLRAEPVPIAVKTGEIRFDGTVVSVDTAQNKIVINVASFTLPNGKSSKLATPKAKTIVLQKDVVVLAAGRDNPRPEDMPPGTPVVIVAKDAGPGKDVVARLAVFNLSNSESEEDEEEVALKPGELRYEGKITGLLSGTMFSTSLAISTNAAGEVTEHEEPLVRNIQVSENTVIYSRSNPLKKLTIGGLKIGLRVTIIGKPAPGKAILAREVAAWDDADGRTRTMGTISITARVSQAISKGDSERNVKSYEAAIKHYNQAMSAALENNDTGGKGLVYGRLAGAYADLGQSKKALECYQQAIAIWQMLGNANFEGTAQLNLSNLYLNLDDLKNARAAAENAIRLYGDSNSRGLGMAYTRLGYIQLSEGETEKAIEAFQRALSSVRQDAERDEEIQILVYLARAYARLKNTERGAETIKAINDILPHVTDKAQVADTQYSLGHIHRLMGANDKARTAYTTAKTLWTELEEKESAEKAELAIKSLDNQKEQPAAENAAKLENG